MRNLKRDKELIMTDEQHTVKKPIKYEIAKEWLERAIEAEHKLELFGVDIVATETKEYKKEVSFF
jgi:hypothetical protein